MSGGDAVNPFERIPEISAWLAESDIDELRLTGPQGTLRLVRDANGQVETYIGDGDESGAAPLTTVAARSAGVFLDRHPLHAEPLVVAGAWVKQGAPIGFLRIGSILTPVVASVDGIVADVLARNGDVVGFGASLIDLEQVEYDGKP